MKEGGRGWHGVEVKLTLPPEKAPSKIPVLLTLSVACSPECINHKRESVRMDVFTMYITFCFL